MLHAVLSSRRLVKRLAINELRGRYSGQVLGVIWAVLQPLTMIVMYTLIFAVVLKVKVGVQGSVTEFGIFLICGMIPFNAVADSIRRSTRVYVDEAHMLRRIPLPPIALVAGRVVTCFIELGIALLLLIGLLVVTGRTPSPLALGLVLLLPLQLAMALGLGAAVASLTVLVRDVGALTETLLTIWLLGTPIFYPRSMVPAGLAEIIGANPMTPLVEAYRSLLLAGRLPPADDLLYLALLSGFMLLFGRWVYERTRRVIVDHI